MKQFIIKIPEGEKITDLSGAATKAVQAVKGQFPSGRVVGTHAVLGYELKLVLCDINGDQFEDYLVNGYPTEDGRVDLMLDWEILAAEGEFTLLAELLPFLDELLVYDENGDELFSTPRVDLGSLQTYAGKRWLV